jgi:Uma2 family endonuclease
MATTEKLVRPAPGAPAPLPQWVERVYRFARPLTPDEFFAVDLPEPDDGGKQELVDGEVVELPGVGGRHGEVGTALNFALKAHVRAHGGRALGRTPGDACYRLALPTGRVQVRCPDQSFVTAEALAAIGTGPADPLPKVSLDCLPALACEIVSDHDRKNPRAFKRKLDEYAAARIPAVWVVDPDLETVAVSGPAAGPARRLRRGGVLTAGAVLPGFALPLDELFDD